MTAHEAKVSFGQWLKRFTREESAIGDLSRDVHADPSWPRGPGSLTKYEAYLQDTGAIPAAITALQDAWARYEQERRP